MTDFAAVFQVLGGVADTVAQAITAVRAQAKTRSGNTPNDFISIEIQELHKEKPPAMGEIGYV
jgi:hypothetical protein